MNWSHSASVLLAICFAELHAHQRRTAIGIDLGEMLSNGSSFKRTALLLNICDKIRDLDVALQYDVENTQPTPNLRTRQHKEFRTDVIVLDQLKCTYHSN